MNSGKKRALRSNKNKKNNYKPRAPKRKKIVKKKMQKEVIPTNEVFTVEGIHGFSFLEERNQLKFRVKWKGYPISMITQEYRTIRNNIVFISYIENLYDSICFEVEAKDEIMREKLKDKIDLAMKNEPVDQIRERLKEFDVFEYTIYSVVYHFIDHTDKFIQKFEELFIDHHFFQTMKKQRKAYRGILREITKDEQFLTVDLENNVDFSIPESFNYIKNNIYETIPEDNGSEKTFGCNCEKCLPESQECCATRDRQIFPYSTNDNNISILILNPEATIFECGESCSCNNKCLNRVTQRLQDVAFSIFKTKDYGWGLKTLMKIEKGAFITDCVGEVMSKQEAFKRNEKSYFFSFTHQDKSYIIDTNKNSNLARYINHSCNANAHVWIIRTERDNIRSLKLGVFALRDIDLNEEITVNYLKYPIGYHDNDIKCLCGSDKCVGYIYSGNFSDANDKIADVVEVSNCSKNADDAKMDNGSDSDVIVVVETEENIKEEPETSKGKNIQVLLNDNQHDIELFEPVVEIAVKQEDDDDDNQSICDDSSPRSNSFFECKDCNKHFTNRGNLKRHRASYHHEGGDVIICYCGFIFFTKEKFNGHVAKKFKTTKDIVNNLKIRYNRMDYEWSHHIHMEGPKPNFADQVKCLASDYNKYLSNNFIKICNLQKKTFKK